jgi:hypothetical protein
LGAGVSRGKAAPGLTLKNKRRKHEGRTAIVRMVSSPKGDQPEFPISTLPVRKIMRRLPYQVKVFAI